MKRFFHRLARTFWPGLVKGEIGSLWAAIRHLARWAGNGGADAAPLPCAQATEANSDGREINEPRVILAVVLAALIGGLAIYFQDASMLFLLAAPLWLIAVECV